jgi:hypothetical protein
MRPDDNPLLIRPHSAHDVPVLLVNGDDDETQMCRHWLESAAAGYAVDLCDLSNVVLKYFHGQSLFT